MPSVFALCQNYPNPFNPETVIGYQLPASGHVLLIVYNVLGNEVTRLVDEWKEAGTHTARFSASNVQAASGVYFYTLRMAGRQLSQKMLLVK